MFCHVDADAFFASVLQRKYPHLKGKAVLAMGMGGGCVIAASYEAKAKGVKTGMPLFEAKKLIKDFVAMDSDFAETHLASDQICHILESVCGRIESTSIDEWYLDLHLCEGGVPKDPIAWMKELQSTISARTDINVSIGIAPTKLLAKMAGDFRKPKGILLITKEMFDHPHALSIDQFLREATASDIPGIGRRREVHARSHRWNTAWDIAHADENTIVHLFGRPGKELQDELLGIPIHSVVDNPAPPKSISRCRTFPATNQVDILHGHMLQHLSYCILKMRRHNFACRGIGVWLRDGNFRHFGDDMKLPQPLSTEEELQPYVEKCFMRAFDHAPNANQIGVVLFNFSDRQSRQYSLFEEADQSDQKEAIQKTLDMLHEKFGRDSVIRAPALMIDQVKRKVKSY